MSIDLSDLDAPHRADDSQAFAARGPCAGLFGWRKDGASSRKSDGEPATSARNYPAG